MRINLSYLTTFALVAKHASFTQAAHELNITVGAVSQQMRLLEQQIGFALFTRHSRGITLTSKGSILSNTLNTHLEPIAQTLQQLMQTASDPKEVKLKLTPSFAYKWLMPRLKYFYNQHPDISVLTYAEGGLVHIDNTSVDLTIDYGQLPYYQDDAIELFTEQLIPVMSPDYYRQLTQGTSHNDFWQQATLLHDAMPYRDADKHSEWQYWLAQHQISTNYHGGHFFNRTDMAMAAAEAGLGVAMARSALIKEEVNRKKLIAPFGSLEAKAGYFLLQHTDNASVRQFKDWLIALCQTEKPQTF